MTDVSNHAIAETLKQLRKARRLTLDQVSAATGVSKSMLSKIESGRASPTAVLLGKIAEGLDVSISQFLGGPAKRDILVLRAEEQPIFRAPKTGFERRSLSPTGESETVDIVLNTLPPKQSSGYFPPHRPGVEETLIVASGEVWLYIDEEKYELKQDDVIFYRAQRKHRFDNPSSSKVARFYIVIDNTRATY